MGIVFLNTGMAKSVDGGDLRPPRGTARSGHGACILMFFGRIMTLREKETSRIEIYMSYLIYLETMYHNVGNLCTL